MYSICIYIYSTGLSTAIYGMGLVPQCIGGICVYMCGVPWERLIGRVPLRLACFPSTLSMPFAGTGNTLAVVGYM